MTAIRIAGILVAVASLAVAAMACTPIVTDWLR